MKVLLLTKYGPKAASSRQRFVQFLPRLEQAGIECTLAPLLDDEYLEHKFSVGSAPPGATAKAFLARIRALLGAGKHDLAVIQYELLPFVPRGVEAALRGYRMPYVYDFDDAVFHVYDQHRSALVRALLGGKIPEVIAGASHVLAGSEYLAAFARRHNASVEMLPTVVDTERYRVRDPARGDSPLTLGWIGSPSTATYLREAILPLRSFFDARNATLALVGSGPVELPGIPLEIRDWSLDREVDDVRAFDVGLMPLPDTPWARGKCGFKLIQYMACGVPVIASPVGANRDIVEHGVNGYLARTPQEWLQALHALAKDPESRRAMGEAGRRKVEREYSLDYAAPRLARALTSAAARR